MAAVSVSARRLKSIACVVRWPGGEAETFDAAQCPIDTTCWWKHRVERLPGKHHDSGPWKSSPAAEPPLPASSRVVLLEPAPLPRQLLCRDLDGHPQPIVARLNGSRGLLINLWATWCTNCLQELSQWSHARQALNDAGIDVLTICVDEPTDDADGRPAADCGVCEATAVALSTWPWAISEWSRF